MPEFTVPRQNRESHTIRLSYEEACAMLEAGFRFGTFRPQEDLFRLSIPYQVVTDTGQDTFTFSQKAEP